MPKDAKELARFHRLADVALRTLGTILAVLFAYVRASRQMASAMKNYVTSVWLLILFGIIASGISLFCAEKEIRVAKAGAYMAILIMFGTIAAMILLVSGIMYSMP